MLLDISAIKRNPGVLLPFGARFDKLSFDGKSGAPGMEFYDESIEGNAENAGEFIRVSFHMALSVHTLCDRCAEPIAVPLSFGGVCHYVPDGGAQEEDVHYMLLTKEAVDLKELALSALSLNLPTKFLCGEDCRGLCALCGANLNKGSCSCAGKSADPRLQSLKKLLE